MKERRKILSKHIIEKRRINFDYTKCIIIQCKLTTDYCNEENKRVRIAFTKNNEAYHIEKFRKCMKVDKRLILVARYYFLPTASEFLINFVKNVVQLLEEGTGCCRSFEERIGFG